MYFIAGVGTADLFKDNNHFCTAKALTDSSLSVGVTAEEIRGGEGAALRGKYFHSSSFGLKLTSAMFDLEYIAANIGSTIQNGGDVLVNKQVTADSTGAITLPTTVVPMFSGGTKNVYVSRQGSDTTATYLANDNNKVLGLVAGAKYCVKYCENNIGARKLVVSADFIPDTVTVILKANLFSGDNSSTKTKVGQVIIKVPRFQLSGTQDISMNMTGASSTSLEGSALAVYNAECESTGYYAEIIEVLDEGRWFSQYESLSFEDSDITMDAGDENPSMNLYAISKTSVPKLLTNAIIAAGEGNISADKKSSLVFSITAGTTKLSIDSATGEISGTAATGTAIVNVIAKEGTTPIAGMDAVAVITVE